MSPKSLATAFEHCLNKGRKKINGDAHKNSLSDNQLDTDAHSPSQKRSESISQDQGAERKLDEAPTQVLLVEDNPVNLKVSL